MNIVTTEQMDRGLAYGEACFETFRVIRGEVFAWPAHVRRLKAGLATFGLQLSCVQEDEIYQTCLTEAAEVGDDVLVRLTVSGGMAAWGLLKHGNGLGVYIQAVPMLKQTLQPKLLHLQDWPFAPKPKPAKFTSDYAETLRALNDVAHADVLFVYNKRLLGGATANVLLYRDHRWWSPDGEGVLPGVVRDFLVKQGLVHLAECSLDWLDDAETVLLSNSGSFLLPVASIASDGMGEKTFDPAHAAVGRLVDALKGQPGVSMEKWI